jgi:hypothetical protein
MAVGFGVALLFKMPSLIREPRNPFLRALCAVIALAGLTAVAGIPAVMSYLQISTGVPAVWLLGTLAVACAAVRSTHLLLWNPLTEARRKINSGLVYYAIALAAIVVLCIMARGMAAPSDILSHQEAPEAHWASIPYVRDAFLVFCATITLTYLDAAVRCARLGKLVDSRRLRRSTWILCIGMVMLSAYAVGLAVYVIGFRFGVILADLQAVAVLAAGCGSVMSVVGVSMPILGPRRERLMAYWRLGPLWRDLGRAIPHVVLERPRLPIVDTWNPWRLDYRLYRRVIEIRDGMLALGPYFHPAVAAEVQRLSRKDGLSEAELAANVVAAQIGAAINDRRAGRPASTPTPPAELAEGSRHHLDSELAFLVPIARAYGKSPQIS